MAGDVNAEENVVQENENYCGKCERKVLLESALTCVLCDKVYHKSCISRLKQTKQITANKVFCCATKVNLEASLNCIIGAIKDLESSKTELSLTKDLIHEMRERNKPLEEKLSKYEKSNLTYAMAASTNQVQTVTKENVPSLIIKPKNNQNSLITKNEICNKIKPAELKVSVTNIKTIRNGGVMIKCNTKNNIETLKNAIEAKLNNNEYEIKTTQLRKPTIKIANFNQNLDTEEIEKHIKEQNSCIEPDDEFKVTYVKKRMNKDSTIFCECSPHVYKKLMSVKKIFIEWHRYPIYDGTQVTRCFRCQEYLHKSQNCQKKMVCEHCGEEHDIRQCQKQVKKCNNCESANIKYKKQYNINHVASDQQCPTYKFHAELQRSKIDYGPHDSATRS